MKKFDYGKSVHDIEELIGKIEDPSTGIEEAGKLISKASETLEKCYAFLRSERDAQKQ